MKRLGDSLQHVACCVLIIAAAAFVYQNAASDELIFDNVRVIGEDQRIQEINAKTLREIWTEDYWSPHILGLYRPVTTTSFAINYVWLGSGDDPIGYQRINVGLHATSAVLFFILLIRLGVANLASLGGALFFAIHPVNTESVTNIVGRSDLLSCLFMLTGMLAYIQFRTSGKWAWAALTGGGTLIAGLSKETAWVLPGCLLLYDILMCPGLEQRKWWKSELWHQIRRVLPSWLLCAVLPVVLILAWRWWLYHGLDVVGITYVDNPLIDAGFIEWQLTGLDMIRRGLQLLLWPVQLCVDYSYAQILPVNFPPESLRDITAIVTGFLLLGLVLACGLTASKLPRVVLFIGWSCLTYLPASNMILKASSIFGERFWYLPLIGLSGLGALALERIFISVRRYRSSTLRSLLYLLTVSLTVIVLTALGARTLIRNSEWKSAVDLFSSAVEVAPMSARNHSSQAAALYRRSVQQGNLADTIHTVLTHSRQCMEITKSMPAARRSLKAYLDYGTYTIEALRLVSESDDGKRTDAVAHLNTVSKEIRSMLPQLEAKTKDIQADFGRNTLLGHHRAIRDTAAIADIYRIYAQLKQLLGEKDSASDWIRKAQVYSPRDLRGYRVAAEIASAAGDVEGEAIAYVQAIILGNGSTRRDDWKRALKPLSQLKNNQGMIFQDKGGYRFNLSSSAMRSLLDKACMGIYSNFEALGDDRNKDAFAEIAIRQFKCSPTLFSSSVSEE
jgi:hypothetical protein